jgi:hypothetical protein
MSQKGHGERFAPPTLSAGYEFSKETIAGTHGNEQDAPTADIAAGRQDRLGSTQETAAKPCGNRPEWRGGPGRTE